MMNNLFMIHFKYRSFVFIIIDLDLILLDISNLFIAHSATSSPLKAFWMRVWKRLSVVSIDFKSISFCPKTLLIFCSLFLSI